MNTKVSIIVPVYNAEKYIEKCVQSLLDQTYKNIEILLIDDESPDGCPQICDRYAAKDPRVKVIHQKNTGSTGARKSGLEHATGTRIAFVDSDDWVLPSMIEEMTAAAEQNAADIVICDWADFSNGEENGVIKTQTLKNTYSMEQIRDEFLMDRHPNVMWNKLYDKELFKDIRFPENIIFEDLFLNGEIFCRCKKVYYLPTPFYCYRIYASVARTLSKIRRKYGLWLAWQEHERICEAYGFDKPLDYCRMQAQQAAIALFSMNIAEPVLQPDQENSLKKYLRKCEGRPAKGLSLKNKLEWWSLKHAPVIARFFGRLHLGADTLHRKSKGWQ